MKTVSTLARSALLLICALTHGHAADEKKPPRGYSIPLIDLAGEIHRQVVVDRE